VLKVKARASDEVTWSGRCLPLMRANGDRRGRWARDRISAPVPRGVAEERAPTTRRASRNTGRRHGQGHRPVYARKLVHKFGRRSSTSSTPIRRLRRWRVSACSAGAASRLLGGAEGGAGDHGVPSFAGSQHQPAVRIYKTYGESAIERSVRSYTLARTSGIGFATADRIARRCIRTIPFPRLCGP